MFLVKKLLFGESVSNSICFSISFQAPLEQQKFRPIDYSAILSGDNNFLILLRIFSCSVV